MSIFSINDNSNYSSILSQSKANKESKENSKISFANAFLKQNASKLNEIQSANSQTLTRSEVLNNQLNSTYDISGEFKNSIYTLKYKQADLNTNTAYGYSVDKDGYMGSDFNKAAGLPEDFKIHKSTLDEIYRYNTDFNADTASYLGVSSYYSNIDIANTIKQYYNKFDEILNHTFNNASKTSFTEADLNSLPKGVSMSVGDFDFASPLNLESKTITNYYNTQEQYNEIEQLGMFGHINTGLQPLNFTPQSMQTQNTSNKYTFNPDMSVYPQNEDGSYSKEALFMSFLKSTGADVLEGGNTTMNPVVKSHKEAMAKESFDGSLASLNDIMTGKVDFASLLKGYAQDGWLDADAYANEGINSYIDSIMDRLNNLIGQTKV